MSVHSQTVPMRTFWLFFLVLLFVHQDFWNWSDESLVGLGMPIGLFYHALFSLACSALGVWAVTRAWPTEWEKVCPLDYFIMLYFHSHVRPWGFGQSLVHGRPNGKNTLKKKAHLLRNPTR